MISLIKLKYLAMAAAGILILFILAFSGIFGGRTIIQNPNNLNIVSTNLNSATPLGITEPIIIQFSEPLDTEALSFEISPSTQTTPLFDESVTILSINPQAIWNYDTEYSIKLVSSIKSVNGKSLSKDYEFKFKTEPFIQSTHEEK